jgi:hypothetical protein
MKHCLYIFLILIVACKADVKDTYVIKDFTSYDFPIKFLVPDSIEIKKSDLGFMLDLTIKGPSNFNLQVFSNDATTSDITKLLEEKKQEVKLGPFFSKMIEEGDKGFIFEKKIDSTRTNYDFRVVKIQGSKEYVFQTALIGKFSLEEVTRMYESVQTDK